MCVCTHIYTVYICMYIYVCMYACIYIYIERERAKAKREESEGRGRGHVLLPYHIPFSCVQHVSEVLCHFEMCFMLMKDHKANRYVS